ncbi:nucleotidyltransferase domain-containing protein [Agromyces neolithicus]|uniref:Polymerase nucleotidyl transferase domain-containing protein n=1 Tax=Agromyces neolithicus TaxID=269420 RepID=A0ABN2LTS6_9MICO
MDLSHPEYVILGENRGRILHRLAVLAEPASGRRIHALSGVRALRSTQRVLDELVALGLVDMQKVGPANAYTLNRGHVLWDPIMKILASRAVVASAVEEAVREVTAGIVVSAAIYGSMARGEAGPESDVDVLLVWEDATAADQRDAVLEALDERVRRLTGNRVQVLAVTGAELARLVEHDDQLVASIRRDGQTVTGVEIGSLLAANTKPSPRPENAADRDRKGT